MMRPFGPRMTAGSSDRLMSPWMALASTPGYFASVALRAESMASVRGISRCALFHLRFIFSRTDLDSVPIAHAPWHQFSLDSKITEQSVKFYDNLGLAP